MADVTKFEGAAKTVLVEKTLTIATIQTSDQRARVYEYLSGLKALKRDISEHYADLRRPFNAALANVRETEREQLSPVETAITHATTILRHYDAAEAERKAEEARRVLEEATRAATARADKLVEAALTATRPEQADALLAQAVAVVTAPPDVPATVEPPKASGRRETWSAEVVDFAALVHAVAAGRVPLTVLKPHQPALNELARAYRQTLDVPGVRAVSDVSYSGAKSR